MTRPAGHRAATSTFTPPSPKTHLSDDYPIGSINHYRSIHPTIDHSTNTAAMGSKRRRGEPKEVWPTFAVSLAHRDWQELFYPRQMPSKYLTHPAKRHGGNAVDFSCSNFLVIEKLCLSPLPWIPTLMAGMIVGGDARNLRFWGLPRLFLRMSSCM